MPTMTFDTFMHSASRPILEVQATNTIIVHGQTITKIETSAGEDFIIFTKWTGQSRTIYLHFEETGNTDCEDPAVGVQASNVLQ